MKVGFRKFIILSVVAHLSVLAFLIFIEKKAAQNKPEIIEISFVDEKNLAFPELKKIVETDSSQANNLVNEKAKFLSEKNNTVAKETRAKSAMKFHNSTSKMKYASGTATNTQDIFQKSFDAYGAMLKKEKQREQKRRGRESSSNDNLENIEEDFLTRVNSREYKYFSYYSRIKNQLNQWWVPKVQQKFNRMIRQGRTIASQENKITKLIIVLNTDGLLVNVQVLAESGVKDLDDAAIEAFRSAAPFPNPPKGIIESDGTVKIRWDCVVES